jgi:hypothetical protein
MLQLDQTIFAQIVAQARADVSTQPDAAKWGRAIDRAIELLSTNPWIEQTGDGLLIAGSEGTYQANGTCQCRAYQNGLTHCKHRVLAKLVRRHDEALAKQRACRPSYEEAVREMSELFA